MNMNTLLIQIGIALAITIGVIFWRASVNAKKYRAAELDEQAYRRVKDMMQSYGGEVQAKGEEFMKKGFMTNAEHWELDDMVKAIDMNKIKNSMKGKGVDQG